MKRILFTVFCLVMLLCALTSCNDSPKHEHIVGEWNYDAIQHRRSVTCSTSECQTTPEIGNHIDEDGDSVCDVCGCQHMHTVGEWGHDNNHHWRAITCSTNECDISLNKEEHFDEDEDIECDVCGFSHTHTEGEWKSNGAVHQKTASCDIGASWCELEVITQYHSDNNNDNRCDVCGAKHEHNLLPWQYTESTHWRVEICPWEICDLDYSDDEHDLVTNGVDYYCTVCGYEFSLASQTHYLRDKAGATFLNDITASDIAEIEFFDRGAGLGPGSFKYYSRSSDEEVIARIFEEYYELQGTPIPASQGDIDGGLVTTVTFTLKNGSTKSININNGNYRDKNGSYYDLSRVPKFKDEDNATETMKFTTFAGMVTVYKDSKAVCQLQLSDLEFVKINKDSVPTSTEKYIIKADFEVLVFVTSEIFYIEGIPDVYYKLVDQSILDFIPIEEEKPGEIGTITKPNITPIPK